MPIAASVQKGTTSFMKCDRPCLPQAHFRLSQYDGNVATTLAKMVLGTSVHRCSTPKTMAMTMSETAVEMTDTMA